MTPEIDLDLVMMKALDGEALDVRERVALDAHLSAHPAERALFERMSLVDRAFASAPIVGAPAGFTAGVMAAIRAEPMARVAPAREAGSARFMIAAGLAVFAALTMLISATVVAMLIPPQAWVTWLSTASAVVDSLLDFPRAIITLLLSFAEGVIGAPAGLAALASLAALVGGWMFAMVRLLSPRPVLARR